MAQIRHLLDSTTIRSCHDTARSVERAKVSLVKRPKVSLVKGSHPTPAAFARKG